VEFSDPL